MRYSLGILDLLFGEKIILQGQDEKGNIVRCKVSKKWLEQAQGGEIVSSPEKDKSDKFSLSLR